MTEPSAAEFATAVADAAAQWVEALGAITDASTGYRAQLERAGYSPGAAERIAGEMHIQLMARLLYPRPERKVIAE